MTTEERRRLICAKVSRRIAEVTPRGLGQWADAWDRVRQPSDVFLDSLEAYLENDTPRTRERIHAATDELVRAWSRAGQEWETLAGPNTDASQSQHGVDAHQSQGAEP